MTSIADAALLADDEFVPVPARFYPSPALGPQPHAWHFAFWQQDEPAPAVLNIELQPSGDQGTRALRLRLRPGRSALPDVHKIMRILADKSGEPLVPEDKLNAGLLLEMHLPGLLSGRPTIPANLLTAERGNVTLKTY